MTPAGGQTEYKVDRMYKTLFGDGSTTNPGLEKMFEGFMVDYRARREEREVVDKKRARLHYALLAGLISFVVGATLWFMSWMTHFMENHHISDNKPAVTQSLSQPPEPTNAQSNVP